MKRLANAFPKFYVAVARDTADDLWALYPSGLLIFNGVGSHDLSNLSEYPKHCQLDLDQAKFVAKAVRTNADAFWDEALYDYEYDNEKVTLKRSTFALFHVSTNLQPLTFPQLENKKGK